MTSATKQLGLAGMPRRLYACTPSRLLSWADCPRRYRFTYVDRPRPAKGPPWAHASLGAAVHLALAAWWRLPASERSVRRAGELLGSAWSSEGFRDEAQSASWRARSREMVERYVAGLDPHDEPPGVERTVGLRTDALAFSGRIDRLDRRSAESGDELVVVDYKTGRRTPDATEARGSLALALYAAAAARVLRTRCVRVELHHLPTATVAGHEHTPESLARHVRRAETLAAEAAAADAAAESSAPNPPDPQRLDEVFPPRPGPLCGWCDYSRSCPEGSAAAAAKEPWAGLGP